MSTPCGPASTVTWSSRTSVHFSIRTAFVPWRIVRSVMCTDSHFTSFSTGVRAVQIASRICRGSLGPV